MSQNTKQKLIPKDIASIVYILISSPVFHVLRGAIG